MLTSLMKNRFGAGLLAGLVAGLAMLGLRPLLDAPTLQELIAEQFLLLISAELFSFILQQVWTLGKIMSIIGVTLMLALAGGLISVAVYGWAKPRLPSSVSSRPFLVETGLALTLWLLCNLALLPVLGQGIGGAQVPGDYASLQLSLLLGFAAYGLTLGLTLGATAETPAPEGGGVSRRQFIGRSLGWVAVLAAMGSGLRFVVSTGTDSMRTFARFRAEPGVMPTEITPVGAFYTVSKNLIDPQVSGDSWRLTLGGMMDHPFSLTLAELRALPAIEQGVTLQCIENQVGGPLISNARWKGVRLADLLERAGIQDGVASIVFQAADGYTESLSVADAVRPEVIVAYDMNDAPLVTRHGFPARILVPGRYGMKSTKWLESIGTSPDPVQLGYWGKQGWDHDAFVKTMSQVSIPNSLHPIVIGENVSLGGIAFAGGHGISRVEFSADDGRTWREASLSPALSPYSWLLWTADWTPIDADRRTLVVRAWDGAGVPQIATYTDAAPSGATGLHRRRLFNVRVQESG